MTYGTATSVAIDRVVAACQKAGAKSIIALAGVPGTGKSYIASIAAQRHASDPLMVREVQFHPSFTYEEFVEGLRIDDKGAVTVMPGVFLEWNDRATDDPDHSYVLLIEELTRANLSAVLGELLTYLEYRERVFTTVYSRRPVRVADNLTLLATYNPSDRTAIEVDAALLRRMRILAFPPSDAQLREMLAGRVSKEVIAKIAAIFAACQSAFPEDYELQVPFGHGIFADVQIEDDLYGLWDERIRHILRRPFLDPHPFLATIEQNYPWRDRAYRVSPGASASTSAQPESGPIVAGIGPTAAASTGPAGAATPAAPSAPDPTTSEGSEVTGATAAAPMDTGDTQGLSASTSGGTPEGSTLPSAVEPPDAASGTPEGAS